MSASLATIGRGFAQPVHGAQQVFRAVLEAMSRPGRVQRLADNACAGIEPQGMGIGLTAVLLALLDAETSVWLDPRSVGPAAADHLRFHTGVRIRDDAASAAFAVVAAAHSEPALWTLLDAGSDEVPQSGATLLVELPLLSSSLSTGGTRLALRGPGIEDCHRLAVGGLTGAFWQARAALEADYPRGIDLILCFGDTLAAIPRTTRVTVEG